MLKPRRDIKASDKLRKKVSGVLESSRRKHLRRNWLWGSLSISAVAAVALILIMPSGMSAKDVLAEAIKSLRDAEEIEMVVEVRTSPIENFWHIDVNEGFVKHSVYIAGVDSLMMWKIDKGDRVAIGKGCDINTWIKSLKIGWHINTCNKGSVLGYLANLLTPRKILEMELAQCINDNESKYEVAKKGDEICLTVKAEPQGDFENPYLLNTSIAESKNIRRYVIDARTKRLKSATVSVVSGKRRQLCLKPVQLITIGSQRVFTAFLQMSILSRLKTSLPDC